MNEFLAYIKAVGDAISLSALIGYFVGALPVVSILFTVIYTGLRIYEMDTVQKWLGKKHEPIS